MASAVLSAVVLLLLASPSSSVSFATMSIHRNETAMQRLVRQRLGLPEPVAEPMLEEVDLLQQQQEQRATPSPGATTKPVQDGKWSVCDGCFDCGEYVPDKERDGAPCKSCACAAICHIPSQDLADLDDDDEDYISRYGGEEEW